MSGLEAPTLVTAETRAAAYPMLSYHGRRMVWDYYAGPPPILHTVCPRCANYGLISAANRRFSLDDQGRLTVDEPFRCDYCLARFRVTDSVMTDA